MNRLIHTLIIATCLSSSAIAADPLAADGLDGFNASVKPFLQKHCSACHGDADGEGGIDLSKLSSTISNADFAPWQ